MIHKLCSKTQGTFFGHPDSAIKIIIDNFKRLGCDHEVLSGQEANERYKFFQLPKELVCAVDKSAGILAASKSVRVLQVRKSTVEFQVLDFYIAL